MQPRLHAVECERVFVVVVGVAWISLVLVGDGRGGEALGRTRGVSRATDSSCGGGRSGQEKGRLG